MMGVDFCQYNFKRANSFNSFDLRRQASRIIEMKWAFHTKCECDEYLVTLQNLNLIYYLLSIRLTTPLTQKIPLITISKTNTIVNESGVFVQSIFIRPFLDSNLRPYQNGASTSPLCCPAVKEEKLLNLLFSGALLNLFPFLLINTSIINGNNV